MYADRGEPESLVKISKKQKVSETREDLSDGLQKKRKAASEASNKSVEGSVPKRSKTKSMFGNTSNAVSLGSYVGHLQ
jgi:hypothetical protein